MSKRFTTGPRVLRDKFNRDRADLDSLLGMNLRGDGIIEVKHVGQGQTIRLNINQLLRRISHVRKGEADTTRIRKGFAAAAAGASGTIACYLDEDGVGDTVNVVCEVAGGTNLNAALPRLEDGTMISVWKDGETWRSVMTFQSSEDC